MTGLEFTLDGETQLFELTEVDDGKLLSSPELIWQYNGAEIDIDSIEDALASLTAKSFTTDGDTDKLELGIKILIPSLTFAFTAATDRPAPPLLTGRLPHWLPAQR